MTQQIRNTVKVDTTKHQPLGLSISKVLLSVTRPQEKTVMTTKKIICQQLTIFTLFLLFLFTTTTGYAANYDITVTPTSNAEGGQISFLVQLDKVVQAEDSGVLIDYTITSGSAEAGDYTPVDSATGQIDFAPTQQQKIFLVNTTADATVEQDETVIFTVTGTAYKTGSTGGNLTLSGSPATAQIYNDDQPTISLTSSVSSNEGDTGNQNFNFTVTSSLNVASDTELEVSYSIVHNSTEADDIVSNTGKVSIKGGNTATIGVSVAGDDIVEKDEDFTVTIDSYDTLGSAVDPVPGAKTGTGTLVNDDQPTINITNSISSPEGNSSTKQFDFTVSSSLQVASDAEVLFSYGTNLGTTETTDLTGTLAGTDIAITGGNSKTVNIDVVGDDIVETDEDFTVNISNFSIPGSSVAPLTGNTTGTGTILNDDDLKITIEASQSAFEDEGPLNFKIDFSNPVEATVTLPYTFNKNSTDTATLTADYTDAGSSPLVFTGNSNGSGEKQKTITVNLVNDSVSETPDEKLTITLSDPDPVTGYPAPTLLVTQRVGTGTIQNDDHLFTLSKTVEPTRGALSTTYGGGHSADDTPPSFIVAEADNIDFDMARSDTCFHIEDFQVDGASKGKLSTYTEPNDYVADTYSFTNVNSPHAINLDFAINTYTIETIALGGNGTITATQEVNCDTAGVTVSAVASTDYKITWFKVDGVEQSGALGLTTYDYTIPINIKKDYVIEVAFSVRVAMTHFSPYGSVTARVYNSPTVPDGTLLTLDDSDAYHVDYNTEIRLDTEAESHDVQGPDYIADDPATPLIDEEILDNRHHDHHLSEVTDNSNIEAAFCDSTGTGTYTDSDYYSAGKCRYTIPSVLENHDLEILFTGIIDVSAHGYGKVSSPLGTTVSSTASGSANVQYEFKAGETDSIFLTPENGWFVQALKQKSASADDPFTPANDPGLTDIQRTTTYILPADYDYDYGLQVNYYINQFTIWTTSTFEKVLFHDSALTDLISVDNNNDSITVDFLDDPDFFVIINDDDFAVVGVSIDDTFIKLETIEKYIAGTLTNPHDAIYSFSKSTIGGNEILKILFNDVNVSHSLEVRDYDNVIIADVPLDAQVNPNPASLMFILDDSGSMDWEYMVDKLTNPSFAGNGGTYNDYFYLWSKNSTPTSTKAYTNTSLQDANKHNQWQSQWSEVNKMYYNPAVVYNPWPTYPGSIDHDNDSTTNEVSSKLPSPNVTGDGRSHANLYRPRHHPWHNNDCTAAMTRAEDLRDGNDVSAVDTSNSVCTNADTFDMDREFLSFSTEVEIIEDTVATSSRSTGWGGYSDYYYTLKDPATKWTKWTIDVDQDATWEIFASWQSNNSRKTINYKLEQGGNLIANVSQDQKDGNGTGTWRSLGIFTLIEADDLIITLEDNHNLKSSSSADRIRIVRRTGNTIINAHYITTDKTTDDKWVVNLTNPIEYIEIIDDSKKLSGTNLGTAYTKSTLPAGVDLITYADPTDPNAFITERQNFADWYSYYRTRTLTAISAVSLAIEKMSNINVGFHTINSSSTYGYTQSALPVKVWGKRDKTYFLYYLLYTFEQGMKGTPLRSGFSEVAHYFDATDCNDGTVKDTTGQSGLSKPADSACGSGGDERDYLSPFAKDANGNDKNGDRCKTVISVLITDGYWNQDGNVGTEVSDTYFISGHDITGLKPLYNNTLAETAYNYRFKKDLMDDLELDSQYMVTYGVAFGLNGSLSYNPPYECNPEVSTDCPTWPKPAADQNTTVDDLWHASINGTGKYLNADSPDSLVQALKLIALDLEGKQGSSSSLAVNGDQLYESISGKTRIFQASWNTDSWTGDFKSYDPNTCTVNNDGTLDLDSCQMWSAADTMKARVSAGTDHRIIATYNPSTKKGVPFKSVNLSDIQRKLLFPYYAPDITDPNSPTTKPDEHILNYLRGDVNLNSDVSQELRARSNIIGDIVNSQGRFQRYAIDDKNGKRPDESGWIPTFTGIIFVGANDGSMHAFSAEDSDKGKELFAYVPNLVFHNLRILANPEYKNEKHKMFVDSSPFTRTLKYKDGTGAVVSKTILIGGLGKGGKGYYCLNITDADTAIQNEADLASRVLWEFPAPPEIYFEDKTATFTTDTITFSTPLTAAEIAKVENYPYFRVVGANFSSGAITATNDGYYKLDSVKSDGTSLTIASAAFNNMVNVDITMTASISDPDMGYSFSKPVLVDTNDPDIGAGGWVVIFGNGYGSENGDSVLYILNPLTGEEIKKGVNDVGKLYTTPAALSGIGFNGMSTPTSTDVDHDLRIDYIYAGDLLGNMWKFDVQSTNASKWQVAYCEGDTDSLTSDCDRDDANVIPKPLFSTALKQPITGAPDIMKHQTRHGYMVIFGTGKYLGWLDITTTDEQSLYGIWDWAPDEYDAGNLGNRADRDVLGVTHVGLTNWPLLDGLGAPVRSLLRQELFAEGTITEDVNNDGLDTVNEDKNHNGVLDPGEDFDNDGRLDVNEDTNGNNQLDTYSYFRIATAYKGDWRLKRNSSLATSEKLNGPDTMFVPLANLGWTYDLPGKLNPKVPGGYDRGERMVNDAIIRSGKAILITFGLSGDKCGASAYSFINERNADTGGMLYEPNFDLNGDGQINSKDTVMVDPDNQNEGIAPHKGNPTDRALGGRINNPIILREDTPDGKDKEKKFTSKTDSTLGNKGAVIDVTLESPAQRGITYWRKIQ